MTKQLLTENQAAEQLGISPRTLQQRRRKEGGIPFIKLGRTVRYDIEDIKRYLDRFKRTSTKNSEMHNENTTT